MKIAVTGYKGRLGSELIRRGCYPINCDVTDMNSIKRGIAKVEPDVIINCAAFTDVNACEDHQTYLTKAYTTNFLATKFLRVSFSKLIVHISTDYVFNGKKGPYSEKKSLTEKPINSYGLSKLGGELNLLAYPELPFCIIRTTCLYETYYQDDFVSKVLASLGHEAKFEATTKLSGNPTYVPHLATAISKLLMLPEIPKVIHLSGRECLTRYEFSLMIANVFGYDPKLIVPSKKKFWVGERPVRGGFKVELAEKLGLPIYSVIGGLNDYKQNLTKKS